MYVPKLKYEDMLKELKEKFKISVVKEQSERVVKKENYRVIIWVENQRKN